VNKLKPCPHNWQNWVNHPNGSNEPWCPECCRNPLTASVPMTRSVVVAAIATITAIADETAPEWMQLRAREVARDLAQALKGQA